MTKYNLTLTLAESQTEEKVWAIEKSYANVCVGQMLKRFLEYFSSYKQFSKLKRRTQTWVQMTKYDLTHLGRRSNWGRGVCYWKI